MRAMWREFGGVQYKFHYGTSGKADAQASAKRLRAKGQLARVVRSGNRWLVYRNEPGPYMF